MKFNYKKRGGIRWFSIGRLSISFCMKKKQETIVQPEITDKVLDELLVGSIQTKGKYWYRETGQVSYDGED